MKKEDLIEKYPELLQEIAQGYSRKIIGKLDSNSLNFKDIWNEYLEENKPKVIGVTFDGFDVYSGHSIVLLRNHGKNQWELVYDDLKIAPNAIYWKSENYKVFHNKDNALKFIEENTKKPIFTTVDDVKIFVGDTFYSYIDNKVSEIKATEGHKTYFEIYNQKYFPFSTFEAAENHRIKHAKVLSIVDIFNTLEFDNEHQEILLNLVKERLNQK